MSDELGSDLGEETTPKALRDAYEALKAKYAESEAKAATLAAKDRDNELTSLIKAKTDKVALTKFYPKDADVSADKVNEWLTENAELFGIDVAPVTDEQRDMADQIDRSNNAVGSGAANTLGVSKPIEVGSDEEILHLFKTLSREELVKRNLLQAR